MSWVSARTGRRASNCASSTPPVCRGPQARAAPDDTASRRHQRRLKGPTWSADGVADARGRAFWPRLTGRLFVGPISELDDDRETAAFAAPQELRRWLGSIDHVDGDKRGGDLRTIQ